MTMQRSPLQLEEFFFTDVVVRANAEAEPEVIEVPLPVEVSASIGFDTDGVHSIWLELSQPDEKLAYTIEVHAFATFKIDQEGCRQLYKKAFNPAVIGVNVARIVYSSARELIASLTARSAYGTAIIPGMFIEPADVELRFETDKTAEILQHEFGMSPEQITLALDK